MLKESFKFNGISAKDLGIELTEPITVESASPHIETVTIPGRNGDLHFYYGSYLNRKVIANCFMLGENIQEKVNEINAWLLSIKGYAKLILDEDTSHYFMARCTSGITTKIINGVLNYPFEITFDCKPQRFLSEGDIEVSRTESFTLLNPTAFESKPIIMFTATGEGEIKIGENTISTTYTGTTTYDSETDTAYSGSENINDTISVSDDIKLYTGENEITISENISNISIIPRWWEI